MLRSVHRIVHYDFASGRVRPDRLTRQRDERYLRAAARMISIYQRGVGQPRQDLHTSIARVLEAFPDCPPKRVAAFAKLMDDAAEWATAGKTAETLRRQVFGIAAPFHPLVTQAEGIFDHTTDQVRQRVAAEIGRPWQEISGDLFADVIELQRLVRPAQDLTPAELLARYNVAQTQALLYRAVRMKIWATSDMKTILRHAKLAGLMHTIRKPDPLRYEFTFDGPATALRMTTRYGVAFAKLIPKLLACQGWRMHASILGPKSRLFDFVLAPEHGLHSSLEPPDAYDSLVEADLWKRWIAAPPAGWQLQRESEILHRGQQVLTPDFVLRRDGDPHPIFVELVGFWTPEYLRQKTATLHRFRDHRWILVVPKRNMKFAAEIRLPVYQLVGRFDPRTLIEMAEEFWPQ